MHVVHLQSCIVIAAVIQLLLSRACIASSARKVVCSCVIVPALERYATWIEAFILQSNNLFVTLLADHNTGITPREIVLVPEGVEREDE